MIIKYEEIDEMVSNYIFESTGDMNALITWFLNKVMLAEAESQAKALVEKYGRPEDGYRNGYKTRTLNTPYGKLVLNKPQFRNHPFITNVFDRYSRVAKTLKNVIHEAFVGGLSIKKTQNLVGELGVHDMSPSTISRICKEFDVEIQKILSREITSEISYLFVDGTYFKVRDGGRYIRKVVLIAYGINTEGMRELLGVKIANSESEKCWGSFFDELIERNLHGVKLVVSDGHKGIRAAVKKRFLGAKWQMCIVHLKRDVHAALEKAASEKAASEKAALEKAALEKAALEKAASEKAASEKAASEKPASEKPASEKAALKKPSKKCPPEVKKIVKLLDKGEDGLKLAMKKMKELGYNEAVEVLQHYQTEMFNYREFPQKHWKKIFSTNGVESINHEIKKRIKKVGAFPNDDSALRLIASVVINCEKKWMKENKYLTMT